MLWDALVSLTLDSNFRVNRKIDKKLFLMQVNPEMVGRLEKAGLSFTGKDITGRRMEVRTLTPTVPFH